MKIVQPLNFDRSYFDVNDAPGGDIALVPYLRSMRVWKTNRRYIIDLVSFFQ